jgi:hypothetical protein
MTELQELSDEDFREVNKCMFQWVITSMLEKNDKTSLSKEIEHFILK